LTGWCRWSGRAASEKRGWALEAARGLASRFADGLALADLAPLAAPGLVVQAVAQAVGVRIELDREPQAAIISLLFAPQMVSSVALATMQRHIDQLARGRPSRTIGLMPPGVL
jgi:hypothetical protein